jgi:hypothetical protein
MKLLRYSLRWGMILFLLVAYKAQSQNTENYKYTPSEVATIHSTVLNEDRKVYIHCPKLDSARAHYATPRS